MEQNYTTGRFQRMTEFMRTLKIPYRIIFVIVGIVSTIWFLVRVIPKPSRASYPCVRATAPWASAFVVYMISLTATVFSFKKFRFHFNARHLPLAALFFVMAMGFSVISLTQSDFKTFSAQEKELEAPNTPMGTAKGIFPGRVVWAYNPEATNENCTNAWGDGYFLSANTDQEIVDDMVEDVLIRLTEESTIADAWDAVFRFHNQERGKGDVGYVSGEIVYVKTNATSAWSGNFSTTDLSRSNNSNYAISETSPQLVSTVLSHLVNVVGVAQSDIYVGDPMKHIYKDNYEKWHAEFPDVHYLDYNYTTLGRERVTASTTATIEYSDRGTVLREGDWSSALTGDPIYNDYLYTIFEEMEYMINLPTLKGHTHAGVTMFAKNHFGSGTRGDAKHLHGGLVKMGDDPMRNEYGMYRVQVDLMSHELLGQKNLIYLMDALYCSEHEVNVPDKFLKSPWNNDWTSSIFVSQDPVAIESVGFDVLYYELDGTNGLDAFPHFGAVDDYLHQAADEANWPAGITYDPENDGSKIGSQGVHEHWNNSDNMLYTRNLGTGSGIELIKLFPTLFGPIITVDNSELPSDQVNSIYVDSSMTVWIGTDAGLSRLNNDGWKHYDTILLNPKVNDIAYELTGYGKEIWVATDGGLTVASYNDLDGITGSTTYVPENSLLLGRKVASVSVDAAHNRWIGTDSALSTFRGNVWATQLTGIDAMGDSYNFADNLITDIDFIERDTLAVITTKGKGVARMSYNLIDGFTGASTYGKPWSSFDTDTILAVDVADTIQWYGSEMGLYHHAGLDAKEGWTFYNEGSGLAGDYTETVLIDQNNNIWAGSTNGISILIPDGGIFNYTEEDGLVNNHVNFLTSDIEGKIWAATSGGIQWFDGIVGEQVVLGIPTLVSPADNALNQELTLDLSWTGITGATSYKLQVATDMNFVTGLLADEDISSTSTQISGLSDNTVYYWRVAAENATLTSSWSNLFTFTTKDIDGLLDKGIDNSISVYPVPFGNFLNLKLSADIGFGRVTIYSIDGKVQLQQVVDDEHTILNTGSLESGVYILNFTNGVKDCSVRIVK